MGYNYKIACKDCRKVLDLDRSAVGVDYADLTDYSKFDINELFSLSDTDEMRYQFWHILRALQFLHFHRFHRVGIIREGDGDDIWEEIHRYDKQEGGKR